ncbi:1-hydroxy-2-methyl-2-butenyl 4-diphosphate reductase [Streptomyces sp. BI20]|uniref:phosphorylase family protein n=1 Tax=Streptomyces sp. BI20 TaxID=3403460 RepID=UPI003C75F8B0
MTRDHPPLLLVCALGVERLALARSPARRPPPGAPVALLRTGMGPEAARRAVTRALGTPTLRGAAVLATGFCAGLRPGMRPGDLIVADRTGTPTDHTPCADPDALAEDLARLLPRHTVHRGPLLGTDHVVRGRERDALRAGGAAGVDMESAVTLATARALPTTAGDPGGAGATVPSRRVAAVRVIVDAPGHELLRPGTLTGGVSAFRALRSALPAFFDWHRSSLLPRR